MNLLLRLYPGDALVVLVLNVLIQVTIVAGLAILVCRVVPHCERLPLRWGVKFFDDRWKRLADFKPSTA